MKSEQQQLNNRELEELELAGRAERAKRIIKFLEKMKAFDFFQGLASNKKEKGKVDFNQFKSFLIRLNGIVRGLPMKERKFDGEDVQLSGFIETILPPKYEDKEEILEYAFETAKDLDMNSRAYMLPLLINALHLFADGNGRTSRILFQLLNSATKSDFDRELVKAINAEGRTETLDINPGLIEVKIQKYILTKHGWHYTTNNKFVPPLKMKEHRIASAEFETIKAGSKKLDKNIQELDKLLRSESWYVLTAITEALSAEKYQAILSDNGMISPIKMQNLNQDDWDKIFNKFWEFKKENVRLMVDIFKEPEKFINQDNKQETFMDLFIRSVHEEYDRNIKP